MSGPRPHTIVGYFESNHCVLCDAQCTELLCTSCAADPVTSGVTLRTRCRVLEERFDHIFRHCLACCEVRQPRSDIGALAAS